MTPKEFARRLRRELRRSSGHVNPLPEDADEQLAVAEREIGFRLPPVLRFIFKHAGQDFFSPEWSVEHYAKLRQEPVWPDKLLPLAEEGCGIWLCLDCSRKAAPVIRWRGDLESENHTGPPNLEHVAPSFVEWLRGQISREEGGYG